MHCGCGQLLLQLIDFRSIIRSILCILTKWICIFTLYVSGAARVIAELWWERGDTQLKRAAFGTSSGSIYLWIDRKKEYTINCYAFTVLIMSSILQFAIYSVLTWHYHVVLTPKLCSLKRSLSMGSDVVVLSLIYQYTFLVVIALCLNILCKKRSKNKLPRWSRLITHVVIGSLCQQYHPTVR